MDLKRWMAAIAVITLAAALCGMILSLTLDSGVHARSVLAQALLISAMVGFAAMALLRPVRRRAESVGRSGGRVLEGERTKCTFDNVAANAEALQSLMELRDYLRFPGKYARYGARMPRGVLLYGPPGTGKTLLARALAGEAQVPFFALSGSDFVEKYVGVGAGRVRQLFEKARKAGRCVVFIDEIDAVGKRRDDASSDERDQTLNALLSEMSGFRDASGVIVIAATNRIEALDPALLRPGRFDRQIEVGLPGREERLSILRLHSRGKPMSGNVNLEELAAQTTSFSGASLENLLNEAAIQAARRDAGVIDSEDIQKAFCQTVAGSDRPMTATEEERHTIALHESGHALANHLLAPENRLARVSILPAGHGAAGYNLCIPMERIILKKKHIENQICVLLAGRAAEQLENGADALTTGASSDISRATELAAAMVTELGMAGEPAVSIKALNHACGGCVGTPEACRALLNALYERVLKLLGAHREALRCLARALMEEESMSGSRAEAILEGALSNERPESA